MKRTFDEQWSDFSGRYGTKPCPLCKYQSLNFSEPKFVTVGGIDVVAVVCTECGHIEFLDVAEVCRIAEEIDKEYQERKWR
mgnify:CR=1 FL=1